MPDVEAVLINTQPRAMSTNLEALPEPVASEDVEPSIGAETSVDAADQVAGPLLASAPDDPAVRRPGGGYASPR